MNLAETTMGKDEQWPYWWLTVYALGAIDPRSKGIFAVVKTFRLIQDGSGLYEGLNMKPKK